MIPNFNQNLAQYVLSDELMEKIQTSQNRQALLEFQIGFEQLVLEPSEFETWSNVIRDRLMGNDISSGNIELATAILIEMAIVLNGSQYNYSRLCRLLSISLKDYTSKVLLPQLSEFVQSVEQYLSAQHLRNLTIFLAEVYDKIEINGAKSSLLAAHILDSLFNLTKYEHFDDSTISTVIQTLKLTGYYLENDRGSAAIDALFCELNERSQQMGQSVSDSSKAKILSLELLRSNKWGYNEQKISNEFNGHNPTINLPNGDQLTDEEFAFLEKNLAQFDSTPEGSPFNTTLDDDVEEDFEKFLQATAVSAAEKALEKVSFDDDDDNLVSPKQF